MQQHDLRSSVGSRKRRKRVGRGVGSGHGTFSTRGVKGQKARTGKKLKPGFEGGQTPLYKRMPKLRGFTKPNKVHVQIVNLTSLSVFSAGETVDRASLVKKGLVRSNELPVKVLGSGDAPAKLTVVVDAMSVSAQKKLEAAGGTFTAIVKKEPQKKIPWQQAGKETK